MTVFGLAFNCVPRRSVKKRCRYAARRFVFIVRYLSSKPATSMNAPRAPRRVVVAPASPRYTSRYARASHGRDTCAELDHFAVGIEPLAVPAYDRANGEGMPQVMDARAAPMLAEALR